MSMIRLLIKPTFFTVGVAGTCFCGATIHDYERRKKAANIGYEFFSIKPESHRIAPKKFEVRQQFNQWGNSLSLSQKMAGCTIFANFLVFAAWRVPRFRPLMVRYFMTQSPTASAKPSPLISMILSNFSHQTPLHFGINMYVLYSLSNIAVSLLGPSNLVGLYITAGTVSSLTSMGWRMMTGSIVGSLGASGSILAIFAYLASVRPDTPLLFFFVLPVSAQTAIYSLLAFDTAGLLARWHLLDHAAHLGGSLTGLLYGNSEKSLVQYRRRIIVEWLAIKEKLAGRSK